MSHWLIYNEKKIEVVIKKEINKDRIRVKLFEINNHDERIPMSQDKELVIDRNLLGKKLTPEEAFMLGISN